MTTLRRTICPICNALHDAASQVGGAAEGAPGDGDFSICVRCGNWFVFDSRDARGARFPSITEWQAIRANPAAQALDAAWRRMKAGRSWTIHRSTTTTSG